MRSFWTFVAIVGFAFALAAQDFKRELNVREGGTVEVVNNYGRVSAKG